MYRKKSILIIKEVQKENPVIKNQRILYKIEKNCIFDFYLPEKKLGIIFLSLNYYSRYPMYLLEQMMEIKKNPEFEKKKGLNIQIMLGLVFDVEDIKGDVKVIQEFCLQENLQLFIFKQNIHFTQFLKKLIY